MQPAWGRAEKCVLEGRATMRKEDLDHSWSVAIGREGVKEGRRMWELRMSGKTGRMSVGVCHNNDDVLCPSKGWVSDACEGHVWHYSSTGGIRAGPNVLHETGVRYSEGDIVVVGLDMERGQLHFARSGASPFPVVEVPKGEGLHVGVAMFMNGCGCDLREVPLLSPAPLGQLVLAASGLMHPPSVPRLALKSVGGESILGGLTRGPVSGSDRHAEGQDPTHGPLSARASQTESFMTRPSPRGMPLVSPRINGRGATPRNRTDSAASSSVAGDTPRIFEYSPQITPRGGLSTATYTPRGVVQPSPRASGAGMSSGVPSPVGVHSSSPFVSPRYMSPRTPRGMLLTSPRRPLEPVAVTMTLRDHQHLDASQKRVAYLEEQLRVLSQENFGLQAELARQNLTTLSEKSHPDQADAVRNGRHGMSALRSETDPLHDDGSGDEEGSDDDEEDDDIFEEAREETEEKNVKEDEVHDSAGEGSAAAEAEAGKQDAGVGEGASKWSIGDLLTMMGWELNAKDLKTERCIGRGSAGSVYQGTWCHARVAIKEVDVTESTGHGGGDVRAEITNSFRQEVMALCKLRHPHVIAFYGATTAPPVFRLVTEILDCDLRFYLKNDGLKATLSKRLEIAMGAACGMAYLHAQSPPVVHRDVKPENFLLSSTGEVKVCDFGLARDKNKTFLQTMHHGGTLVYIAPEVHRGQDFDEGCDVYAFAIVLWELITLKVPFDDKAPQSIPGIVGWGGERPSLEGLRETIAQEADSAEGRGLAQVEVLLGDCWGQKAETRIAMPIIHERLCHIHVLITTDAGHMQAGDM